jgi:hypothetical protein
MGQVVKKENITIKTGEYQKDGQTKNRYKTIGELITYQNDDGSYSQFGEMWGPTGVQKFNVYEQSENRQQAPQQAPQMAPPTQAAQAVYGNQPTQHPHGQPMGAYNSNEPPF